MRTATVALLFSCLAGIAAADPLPDPAVADPAAPAAAPVTIAKPQKPPGKLIVHANFAFNVYTWLGNPYAGGPDVHLHPGNRATIFQQIGFGYFFHKMLRVQLTLQFGETLTNVPEGKSPMALFGIIPWLVFAHKGFAAGVGPILAPISANTIGRFDAGIFSAVGYAFKLPKGFSLATLCQFVFMFVDRPTVAITPALMVAYRF